MSKFEARREEAKRRLEEELRQIEEDQRAHQRKVVKPIASKFAALLEEEMDRLGGDNLDAVEGYKFNKSQARESIRKFLLSEFAAVSSDAQD